MDPLADQRRYLAAAEAAAEARPDVHACQRAALARERALAAAAAGGAAYRAASGDLFELARAAWLDRLVAHARVAAATDDPWTVRAAAIELDATLAARGHADWTATLVAGSAAAAPWHDRAATARAAPQAIVTSAMRAAWDRRAGTQAETRASIEAAWAQWIAVEPEVAAAPLAAILAQPRRAMRLPWPTAAIAALLEPTRTEPTGELHDVPDAAADLAAIDAAVARWRASLDHVTPGPVTGGEPDVAAVIAPYASLASMAGDAPAIVAMRAAAARLVAHARGATTAQGVLAAWTEADLLADFAAAPVRAAAEAVLARADTWPDPLLAAGARALLADLSGIRTGTDVDLVSMHHGACAAIEADWNAALAGALFAPLLATAIAGWDPPARASIAPAWRLAHDVAGVGAGLLAVPRVASFLDVLAAHASLPSDLGAWLGEIGHELAGEARAWFGIAGHRPAGAAAVAGVFTAAWGAPPPHAPLPVRLWGHARALDDLAADLPPRPPVPGRSRPAAP